MGAAVVVGSGPRLYLVDTTGAASEPFSLDPDPELAAVRWLDARPETIPSALAEAVSKLPRETRLAAAGAKLVHTLALRTGRAVAEATPLELRTPRAALPSTDPALERRFLRALARLSLEGALKAPEEILITLAREEERVERAVGREERALESFVNVPASPLVALEKSWEVARTALAEHHARLLSALESEARHVVPNLSSLVGPRVAARLVAAAGGLAALGRMRAPRIQLLGSRRRPSAERGPRYGLIYRADRLAELPLARRGAYARSLAAIAAIAVRADALTRRDLSSSLVARRDRRIEELRRRRG